MPIILALDASSHDIGFTLAEDERYILSGQWSPKGDEDTRMTATVQWVDDMITRYEVGILAIEEPAVVRNGKVDRLLARVCGHCEAVIRLRDGQVILIHPSTVKRTGFSKDKLEAATRLTPKQQVGGHEADSLGVWQAALCEIQELNLREREMSSAYC